MMRRCGQALLALSEWVAPDDRFRRDRLLVVLAAAYTIFVTTYLAVNIYSIGRTTRSLWLPGETALPFIPEFEYFYVLGYLFPLLPVLHLPGTQEFRRLLLAFGLTLLVAYTTYLVFPVYLERPHLDVDSIATFLLSLEYHDPSYNHFPSLHLGTVWIIYLACRRGVRHHSTLVVLLLAISVSTLFVKQHYVVDVLSGIGLALAAWWASGRIDTRLSPVAPQVEHRPLRSSGRQGPTESSLPMLGLTAHPSLHMVQVSGFAPAAGLYVLRDGDVVSEAGEARIELHTLMDYNNHPDTSFDEVLARLRDALARVREELG